MISQKIRGQKDRQKCGSQKPPVPDWRNSDLKLIPEISFMDPVLRHVPGRDRHLNIYILGQYVSNPGEHAFALGGLLPEPGKEAFILGKTRVTFNGDYAPPIEEPGTRNHSWANLLNFDHAYGYLRAVQDEYFWTTDDPAFAGISYGLWTPESRSIYSDISREWDVTPPTAENIEFFSRNLKIGFHPPTATIDEIVEREREVLVSASLRRPFVR